MHDKIQRFLQKPFHDKLNSLRYVYYKAKGIVYYRKIFGSFGTRSMLGTPLLLTNSRCIYIGSNVNIREGVRLEAIYTKQERIPKLLIEDGVNIEQRVQIVCHSKVTIRKNAGIGPNCIIMDTSHPFFDIHNPQPITQRLSTADSFVEIGEGALLGAGTFIMPNVHIGKHTVIGANSVVHKSIPPFCVATGNPAKVQLRYDPTTESWSRM